jgi:hypothetical protein
MRRERHVRAPLPPHRRLLRASGPVAKAPIRSSRNLAGDIRGGVTGQAYAGEVGLLGLGRKPASARVCSIRVAISLAGRSMTSPQVWQMRW